MGRKKAKKKKAIMLKAVEVGYSVERLAGFQCPEWCHVIDKLRMI